MLNSKPPTMLTVSPDASDVNINTDTEPDTAPDNETASVGSETVPDPDRGQHRRSTNWGVFSYIALGLVTLAVAWALVLSTVLVMRSGRTNAQLLQLLTTGQQARQHDVDVLNQQLKDARAASREELAATRQQAATTTGTAAKLSSANAKAWQDVAKSATSTAAAASSRRIDLAESALDRSATTQQTLAATAANAVAQAGARQDATLAALAQLRRESAADRAALLDSSRAALGLSIQDNQDRLSQLQSRLSELKRLSPHDRHLLDASRHLEAAQTVLTEVKRLQARRPTVTSARSLTRMLQGLRLDLQAADRSLQQVKRPRR